MRENGMREKQRLLKQLRDGSQSTMEEIQFYYERLIQEFERRYPPLTYVEEIHISGKSMEQWIAQHCRREM